MVFITLITSIVLFAFGALIAYLNKDQYKDWPDCLAMVSFFLAIMAFGMFIAIILYNTEVKTNEPTALDVYRGKTTLEITYRDSIPVDSVVVFKDK